MQFADFFIKQIGLILCKCSFLNQITGLDKVLWNLDEVLAPTVDTIEFPMIKAMFYQLRQFGHHIQVII